MNVNPQLFNLMQIAATNKVHLAVEFVMQGNGFLQLCYKIEVDAELTKATCINAQQHDIIKANVMGENIIVQLPNYEESVIVIKLITPRAFLALMDMVAKDNGGTQFYTMHKNFIALKQIAYKLLS